MIEFFFHYFLERGTFEQSLNATFIALILKKAGAVEMKDFKPISLLGAVCNILAKVLANRWIGVLRKIISDT